MLTRTRARWLTVFLAGAVVPSCFPALPALGADPASELLQSREVKVYNLQKEYRKLVTLTIKPGHAKAVELKPIIESMLSIYGSAYVIDRDNTLLVTDTAEMIENLRPAVQRLDVEGLRAGGNLSSKLIRLRHTGTPEIMPMLKHKLSASGLAFEVAALDAVLVTDVPSKIEEIEALLESIDAPAKHVQIDIVILEADTEFYRRFGLDALGVARGINVGGNVSAADNQTNQTQTQSSSNGYAGYNYVAESTYRVLGGNVFASKSFALGDLVDLIQRDGGAKIVASPRLVTKNNVAATLDAQELIPWFGTNPQFTTFSENVSRAGVSVVVLPVIEADGFVDLAITPRISDLTGWTPNGMPIIFDRSMKTDVRVKDGDTYVLGGLKRTETVDGVQGIPILKSIPLLGWLFSKKTKVKLERDVAIFIRPRILEEGMRPSAVDDKFLPDIQPKGAPSQNKP